MSENNNDIDTTTEDLETLTDDTNKSGSVPDDEKNAPTGKGSDNAGVYVHKFKEQFEYQSKKYTTINFYFEQLTGRDMINIENEMQANNEYALDPLLSRNFQSKMAARAGGIASDALEAMPILDFNKIVTAARNFLIDSGY